MIDMTIEMNAAAPGSRNHFQGNGNCDATREANKRADRSTGRESEIAPYHGIRNLTGSNGNGANGVNMNTNQPMNGSGAGMESELAPLTGAENRMPAVSGAENQIGAYAAAQNGMTPGNVAQNWTTPNDGGQFGPGYDWTSEDADGMTSIPQDSFNEPLDADEAARNSWRALLARNVGRSVLVRFLMGTQNMVAVEGELYEVGTDYIVIYQPLWDSHITADLYSVKFVEFREPPGGMMLN